MMKILLYFLLIILLFYSILQTINLQLLKKKYIKCQLSNKTLEALYNSISAFKHDFMNIITAIGGYIYANDINGLSEYYFKILDDCQIASNLSLLNPKTINNPAIYSIFANKYHQADEQGITTNLQIYIDLQNLGMNVYEFTRILAILLDNAIEAASKCNSKIIQIDFHDVKQQHYQILTIKNTYLCNSIDFSKIYEKGYTTKTNEKSCHGIGLWQVSKIINKHKNVELQTSSNEQFFMQELKIYY